MYIIGIDEVGRGPIAGPVAVGAFVLLDPKIRRHFKGAKESKQLTHEARLSWLQKINQEKKRGRIGYEVTMVSGKIIDSKGLSFAIKTALATSLKKLNVPANECRVFLDGGLKAPEIYKKQKTIIKGDEKEMVIALASIVAKVRRDRYMITLAKKYASYGFDIHKGYGTRAHYEAIQKYGLTPLHRRSFLKGFMRAQAGLLFTASTDFLTNPCKK